MIITRKSKITGRVHGWDLPVTQEQLDQFDRGESYAQDIFRGLTADQREFLMTGITPEEWKEYIGEEPDE